MAFSPHRNPATRPTRRGRIVIAALLLIATLLTTGCVRRRMLIRSNPAGAMVYVDDYPIGVTPVATNFTYYGVRKIRLVKDGYETLTVMQPVRPPWYQVPPLDFVSENVVPGEIRDQRSLTFNLTPQTVVPTETLLGRAEQLRTEMDPALAGTSPPPVTITPGATAAPGPSAVPSPGSVPTPGSMPPPSSTPLAPPGVGGQPVYPLPGSGR